ncbi:hypothetical protein BN903_304 [Halorubrum sp. AJ67]|nr:hypothetical protein BN903_304 [Halorubrum sp. AJ67]
MVERFHLPNVKRAVSLFDGPAAPDRAVSESNPEAPSGAEPNVLPRASPSIEHGRRSRRR